MFHKRLMKEFKCNIKYVAGIVATRWIAMIVNVILVGTLAAYIDHMVLSQNAHTNQIGIAKTTIWLIIVLVGTLIIRGMINIFSNKMSFLASSKVKSSLREQIYEKLMKLGTSYRDTISTSEAVQISTEGVEQLEMYFEKYVPQFFYSLLAPTTLFFIIGSLSVKVAVVLLICVPLIPISIMAVQKFAKKMLNKYWGTYTELGDSFLENLQGLTTLKIYQADERYAVKMDEEAEKFRKVTMKVLIMQLNSISIMDLVAFGGAAVGIILSILEYRAGNIGLGQCFFIVMISAEFFLPLRQLGSYFHIAMNGNAAANKIFSLLDTPETETEKKMKIQRSKGKIQIKQVTFAYKDRGNENGNSTTEVLSDMTLEISEHKFTALVGTSGSGKSTIASLIMGDYKEYTGTIWIGNQNIYEIGRAELLQKITRIRHDSYLFKGTVKENLEMGKENATSGEMEAALKQVNLWDTVMEKGGLEMRLTEKASNLSGGQKQRLALARAILHDSDIYIFDEATSNIDTDSEAMILEVIHKLAKSKTVLLITHKLANVIEADEILVLQDGRVVERGTHREMVSQKGYYHKLYESQMELEKYQKEVC